ncbi:MAG: methyltransferase domain-containing protein, partial [Candidatus Omnitrophota bacterium]
IVQKNHLGQFQVAQRLVRIPKKKFEGRVHVGVTPGYTGRQTLLEELWMDGTIDEELVISMDSMLIKLGRHLDNHFGPVGNFGCKLLIGQDQKIYVTFITDMPFQAPVGITPIIQERVEQTMRIADQALWRYVNLRNRTLSKEYLNSVELDDSSQGSESSSPLNALFQSFANMREVLRKAKVAKRIFTQVHQAMLSEEEDDRKEFYLPAEAKFFTTTLVRHGLIWQGAQVLDMGCGLGPLSTFAAIMKADVLAIDIQEKYIRRTREIAEELGVSRSVTCVQSNLFEALKTSGLPRKEQFDLIVFFPPIFDDGDEGSECPEVLDPGFRVIRKFVHDAPAFLRRQGAIAILYPCYRSYRYLLEKLAAENKLSVQIMARKFRCSFIVEGDGFGGGDIGFARMYWAVYVLRPLPVERVKVQERKVVLGRLGLASSSPLQIVPTKVFMQSWRLLSKDEQKVASKKIRHVYLRWQQSKRIAKPLAYFPGVNAGHIHITKADSLFYSVNTDLDTLFLMVIDSHSNSAGLFYNSDIVVLRRFLEQFKGPDVDRRILDEAGFKEIGRVKIEGLLTLQKALEAKTGPEPENEQNDTGGDEFDLNRIWVGRQIRTAKELAKKESADFVDVLWNEYGEADRKDAMYEWVRGAVMPRLRLQWQELLAEDTITSEIKNIVDIAYTQRAVQAVKAQKPNKQGRSGFAAGVIVDDTLKRQQRRLLRLEEETNAGLVRALSWKIMDPQEEQAIRLRLEVWHIAGGNLDNLYVTGDSRSYKCASQEIKVILSCLTEKVKRIATLQEGAKRALSEILEAAEKRLNDLAPPVVALEAGQGHIAACRAHIQTLTTMQEYGVFITAEIGIKEELGALNALNNLLAEVSDMQSQWSGLNLGGFQESSGYAQIINTLRTISADLPLGEAVKRAAVCLEPIRQITGQTKRQLETVKRQNLLEGLEFYVQETQSLARNILSELRGIAPAEVKALDAMIDDFDLVLLPFMRNEMRDIMLQEDIKRSGRAFDFAESAASTRQHVKRGYSGYRTWAGNLRQAINGMPQRAIQEIESILGTTQEMIAGLRNRLEGPGELTETELLKQIKAFRQNNLNIGKAYALAVMTLCCVRFHIREEILVETKAILEDIAQWKLGDRAGILKHHDRPADIAAERLMETLDSDQQKKHDAMREVLGDEMLARYREAEFTPNDIMEGENLFNAFLAQNRIFSLPRDSMVIMAGRELAFFWQWAAQLIKAQPATLVCVSDFRKALAEPHPEGLQYEELIAYLRFRVEFLL